MSIKTLLLLTFSVLLMTTNGVAQSKQSVEELLRKGLSLNRKKNYTEAVHSYTKAIEINPNNSEAYFLRGESYIGLKQYQDALNDYEKSIGISKGHLMSILGKGRALKGLKKFSMAEDTYTAGINLCAQYLAETKIKNNDKENVLQQATIRAQRNSVVVREKDLKKARGLELRRRILC